MPSFRLTLAYDGTDFAGSQIQPNQRTVQGELEDASARSLRSPFGQRSRGRTDRGVHALGQVVAVGLPAWSDTSIDLLRALNSRLPGDLGATDAALCGESFNPRFDAVWREYRYWIATVCRPFLGRYAWNRRSELDAEAVRAGAGRLVGTHDFASFAGGGEGVPWSQRAAKPKGTARTILRCDCREIRPRVGPGSDRVGKSARGSGRRGRILAPHGSQHRRGIARRRPRPARSEWIDELLAERDRRSGSVTAPPHGLTLTRVGFGGDVLDDD